MATTPTTAHVHLPFGLHLPESVSVLAERDYRVVWSGQAVSMVGTWMQMVAQGLVVLQLWDSAFALGTVNFANALPSLFVMLFGGVLADRADKRRILIATQIVMCVLAVAVGLLVVTDQVQFWMIIVATVLLGVAFGYDMPAYQAFLPELVPPDKISQVVALNSSTFHGARMIGPALAGAVIKVFGLGTAYFLNAASFVAVILSLLVVRHRPAPAPTGPRPSAMSDLKAGFRHARERTNLQVLLALTALNTTFLFPTMAILSPFYVKNVLHQGPGYLGLFWGMSGVGSLIGAMALIWWPTQARASRIWAAALIGPIGLTIMALTREPAVALVTAGIVSASFSSQLGVFQSMIQESTPRAFRGRVMSLHGITFNSTMPIAGIASAGFAELVGLPAVMVVSASAYLAFAILILRFAGGGIQNVVRESRLEYDEVAAAG